MNNSPIVRVFLITCSLTCSAFGQGDIFDQQYDSATPPNLFDNVTFWSPIGQEFTPTLGSLSFVDLFFENAVATPDVLSVEIHSQTITGTLLGASTPETLPGHFFGIARFTFASPVALQPGSLDVISIVQASGDELVGVISPNTPPYSGGHYIVQGAPEPNGTMWFREGVSVPEPSAMALLATGASLLLMRGRRHRA
jgi:hypothetical protein